MLFFYEDKGMSIHAKTGSSLAFSAHLHHHIELVYMIEGRVQAFVDFKEYTVGAGDAFIVFPNQIHQYQRINRENYIICIFPPDLCPEFLDIFKSKIPISPVVGKACENIKIPSLLKNIVEVNLEKKPFCSTLIKGYFLILLSELFRMIQFEEVKLSDVNTIKEILNYCTKNYNKDVRLEAISNSLHISKYHISHLFSQKLRMGINEYIGMLRISDACNLLVGHEKSIIEIAYSVGFNSIRTFNRLFQKYTGTTPKQYKNQQHSRQEIQ